MYTPLRTRSRFSVYMYVQSVCIYARVRPCVPPVVGYARWRGEYVRDLYTRSLTQPDCYRLLIYLFPRLSRKTLRSRSLSEPIDRPAVLQSYFYNRYTRVGKTEEEVTYPQSCRSEGFSRARERKFFFHFLRDGLSTFR